MYFKCRFVFNCLQYRVEDLLEFCDRHFHIAVNEGNALAMYKLAKRHGLKRAQARLREDFAKYELDFMHDLLIADLNLTMSLLCILRNIDLLLQSIAH